jgi:HNH endonuclease/NUMOD4 motif
VQTALSSLAYGEVNLPEKESTTQLEFNFEAEEWRPVVGYEGIYEVSNLGRFRRIVGGVATYAGRIMSPPLDGSGYPQVWLCAYPRPARREKLHILVAEAFIGPRPPGKEINHKNANKTDARVENLEYITHKENNQHAFRLGLVPIPHCKGEHVGTSRLTEEQVRQIHAMKGTMSHEAIAKQFDVCRQTVTSIFAGRLWKHIHPSST